MRFTVKRRISNTIAIIFVVVLFVFNKFFIETAIGITLLIAFLVMFLIWKLLWLRCPHCNSCLLKLPPSASHCPYCGDKFE